MSNLHYSCVMKRHDCSRNAWSQPFQITLLIQFEFCVSINVCLVKYWHNISICSCKWLGFINNAYWYRVKQMPILPFHICLPICTLTKSANYLASSKNNATKSNNLQMTICQRGHLLFWCLNKITAEVEEAV